MKVKRPQIELEPFGMLASSLEALVAAQKVSASPASAPPTLFLPYFFCKASVKERGTYVFALQKGARVKKVFAALKDRLVPFEEGWTLAEDKLYFPDVGELRGVLLVGYSFVNPYLLEAGKRLPFWEHYERLWKSDPVELAFRVRDTYHAISQLPKEKAYLSLATIFLGLPYAKASGTLVRQELSGGTVKLLIDGGDVLFEQVEHPTPKALEHWVAKKGQALERGQPLTDLVRLESDKSRLVVHVGV